MQMSSPPFIVFLLAMARYLPFLSSRCSEYLPRPPVRSVPTVSQEPFLRCWILTVTSDRQALNPSPTLTVPIATRLFLSFKVTDLVCFMMAVTVKSLELVAVPPGVVTVIRPLVAAEGTVADIRVEVPAENDAVMPLKVTDVAPMRFVP
jgi:hypothetical protein